MFEGGVDSPAVLDDATGQLDEGGDAAAPRPGDPPVQGLFAFLAFDGEYMPKSFFEQVGAVQSGVGLGDPGQLGALGFGEVLRVLPQRVPGAFELAGALSPGPRRGASAGPAATPTASLRASARASFQARRRSVSSASVAQATTWNGSAHSTAAGQRSATTAAIQSAASAETWVI